MSNSKYASNNKCINNKLIDFGVAIVGDINLELVNRVKAQLESLDIKQQRYHQQTKLKWSSAYNTIIRDFETVSKQAKNIYTILIE
jgi:hypothetical protein